MSAIVGPIRFNSEAQALAFVDWLKAEYGLDPSGACDDDIRGMYDDYVGANRCHDRIDEGDCP